jgi:hypothetical protein
MDNITDYLRSHRVAISLLLATYGAVYLSSVILGGWTLSDWGKDITIYPPSSISALLPRSYINPMFFVTSIPALFIGTVALCIYSIRGINADATNHKEHVAILLTAAGFAYQVIGAWPLGNVVDFPWEWQKQIIQKGATLSWALYALSFLAFVIGGTSLYLHSRIYHQKHPELALES